MNNNWETPQNFFNILDNEFHFTLDVAALPHNHKCKRYYTPAIDALTQDWTGEKFWMNPPYGRGINVYSWVRKAYYSARDQSTTGVCLLPVSTDTKWFHGFCMKANEIRFIKDRLWFSLNGVARRSNHRSMVVIFTPSIRISPIISTITNGRMAV